MRAFGLVWLGLAAAAPAVQAQARHISPAEAKNHVGEKATVCGTVVGAHFVSSGKGQPTFLHFDEQYPKQIFTAVIWGVNRPKFGKPEVKYLDQSICVTGKIEIYLEIPEIVVTKPKQIREQK